MRLDFAVLILSLIIVSAHADPDASFGTAVNDGFFSLSEAAAKAKAASAAASSSRSNPNAFDWRTVQRPSIGIGAEYTKVFKDGWDETLGVLAHTSSCAKFFADNGHPVNEVAASLQATNYKVYAFKKGEESIGAKTLGPVDVEINAAGIFVTATDGKIALNRRGYDLAEVSNVRGMILLHELGHELGIFPADREDAALNAHHSLLIIQNCFPMYSMPKQN